MVQSIVCLKKVPPPLQQMMLVKIVIIILQLLMDLPVLKMLPPTVKCQGPAKSIQKKIAVAKEKLQEMVFRWIEVLERRPDIFLKPCQSIVDSNQKKKF